MRERRKRSPQRRRGPVWFALADEQQCRLLKCRLTRLGTPHVEMVERHENTWPGHEYGRPMPLRAKDGHSYAAAVRNEEEDANRYARELAPWIQERFAAHQLEHLTVFAPPRFLGVLRKTPFGEIEPKIDCRLGDLVNLSEGALAEHPRVRELIDSGNQASEVAQT